MAKEKKRNDRSVFKERKCRKYNGRIWLSVGKGVAVGGMIAWLFYQSAWACVCIPFCIALMLRKDKKKYLQIRQETEQESFFEYLGFVKEALAVGYALEQAVSEGKKGLLTTRTFKDDFVQAVNRLERKMQLGTSVEAAFSQWAEEALCEEIRDFSEVLMIAKRTGGAVQQAIENTERVIREKQETLRYIRALLHSREYEAKVMKGMPFVMLLYLQLFMPDFMAPLYRNPLGVCIMSVVLGIYLVLCLAVDKITAISL